MGSALGRFFFAPAKSQSQLVLRLVKVFMFPLYTGHLFLQPPLHRRTRQQAVPTQIQQAPDLTELESQTLYAAHEGQRFDIIFAVPPAASLCPRRSREAAASLLKHTPIHTEDRLFFDE